MLFRRNQHDCQILSARYKFNRVKFFDLVELIKLFKRRELFKDSQTSKNSMIKRQFNFYTIIYIVEIMTLSFLLEESRLETQTLIVNLELRCATISRHIVVILFSSALRHDDI